MCAFTGHSMKRARCSSSILTLVMIGMILGLGHGSFEGLKKRNRYIWYGL